MRLVVKMARFCISVGPTILPCIPQKLFGHFSGNADVAEEAPKMSAKVAENVATAALPSLISELKGIE